MSSNEKPEGREPEEERLKRPEDEIKDLEVADEAEAVRGGLGHIKGESGDDKHKDEIEVLR